MTLTGWPHSRPISACRKESPGLVRAWGCVGQMGLGGLGLAYPRRQSRWAAPRTPTPRSPIMHHWAGAGARWWGWGGLAASGLTKAPLYCSPHPDWRGWPSLTANHSQPWPALPWAAFLPRSSLPPSHLWGSFPSNVPGEPETWKPTCPPPENERVRPRQCRPVGSDRS